MDIDWGTYVVTDKAGHLVPIGHTASRRDAIIALRKYAGLMCGSNTPAMCAFMRQHKLVKLEEIGKQYRRRQKGRNTRTSRGKTRKILGTAPSGKCIIVGVELV